MQHDEFVGQVQNRAKLPSRGDAEGATRATLETLGERIPETLAVNLASQLPQEIGEHLRRTVTMGGTGTGTGSGERFGRDEFIRRVAQRSYTDEPQAAYQSRVVLEVFREATTGGSVDKVRDALPDELRALVDAGSSGSLE
jgi:uncharacterized protein (DUF2267 family)